MSLSPAGGLSAVIASGVQVRPFRHTHLLTYTDVFRQLCLCMSDICVS